MALCGADMGHVLYQARRQYLKERIANMAYQPRYGSNGMRYTARRISMAVPVLTRGYAATRSAFSVTAQ
eukprot:2883529-Rhodomonas_salina.3